MQPSSSADHDLYTRWFNRIICMPAMASWIHYRFWKLRKCAYVKLRSRLPFSSSQLQLELSRRFSPKLLFTCSKENLAFIYSPRPNNLCGWPEIFITDVQDLLLYQNVSTYATKFQNISRSLLYCTLKFSNCQEEHRNKHAYSNWQSRILKLVHKSFLWLEIREHIPS